MSIMRRVSLRALPTPPAPPPTSSGFLFSPYVRAPQPPPLAVSVVQNVRSSIRVCRSHSGERAGTSFPFESRRRRHVFGEYLITPRTVPVDTHVCRAKSSRTRFQTEGGDRPTARERKSSETFQKTFTLFDNTGPSEHLDSKSLFLHHPSIRPWVSNLRRFTYTPSSVEIHAVIRRGIRKTKVSNTIFVVD